MQSDDLPDVFRDLFNVWQQKRGNRRFPPRRSLDAFALRPWLGHIGIVERGLEDDRYFIRLAGTVIVEYDGADFTGKCLSECVPPHAVDEILYPYRLSIQSGKPVFNRLPPGPLRGSFEYFDRLLLPCADEDSFIDSFIVAIYVSAFNRHRNPVGGIYGTAEQAPESKDATTMANRDAAGEGTASQGAFIDIVDL